MTILFWVIYFLNKKHPNNLASRVSPNAFICIISSIIIHWVYFVNKYSNLFLILIDYTQLISEQGAMMKVLPLFVKCKKHPLLPKRKSECSKSQLYISACSAILDYLLRREASTSSISSGRGALNSRYSPDDG